VAAQRNLILITENHKDFLNLHEAWHRWARAWNVSPLPVHSGILTVPQLPSARLDDTAAAIAQIVSAGEPLSGELRQWTVSQGWK
jgi:hypothetical protein